MELEVETYVNAEVHRPSETYNYIVKYNIQTTKLSCISHKDLRTTYSISLFSF